MLFLLPGLVWCVWFDESCGVTRCGYRCIARLGFGLGCVVFALLLDLAVTVAGTGFLLKFVVETCCFGMWCWRFVETFVLGI